MFTFWDTRHNTKNTKLEFIFFLYFFLQLQSASQKGWFNVQSYISGGYDRSKSITDDTSQDTYLVDQLNQPNGTETGDTSQNGSTESSYGTTSSSKASGYGGMTSSENPFQAAARAANKNKTSDEGWDDINWENGDDWGTNDDNDDWNDHSDWTNDSNWDSPSSSSRSKIAVDRKKGE